jgi:hypothetical protein
MAQVTRRHQVQPLENDLLVEHRKITFVTISPTFMGREGSKGEMDRPRRAPEAPSWTLSTGAASGSLILRFIGPTATREIPEFLAALTQKLPAHSAHIIFDLRELTGHNLDTRAPIQRWLKENRFRIVQVTVLVKKAATIIKMATSVVALATGMKIEIRDDLGSDLARRM